MTADNRTNEELSTSPNNVSETGDGLHFSEAQVEAAAKSLSPNPERWKDFVPTARRALVAAAGAAPQAESDDRQKPAKQLIEDAVWALINDSTDVADRGVSQEVHDDAWKTVSLVWNVIKPLSLPVQQVSESDLAEVIRGAKSSWLRACGTPGHVEDIDVWITRAVLAKLGGEWHGEQAD